MSMVAWSCAPDVPWRGRRERSVAHTKSATGATGCKRQDLRPGFGGNDVDSSAGASRLCAPGQADASRPRRRAGHRLHPRAGRSLRHPDPRRPGRGGDQDREPRPGRRHALHRPGAGSRRRELLFPVAQPRQAERRHRPDHRTGPAGGPGPDRHRRYRGGKLHDAGDAAFRPRLPRHPRAISQADLLLGLSLWPGGPQCECGRL
jgi:hypothetical protein